MKIIQKGKMWVKMEEPHEPVIRALLGPVTEIEMTIFDLRGQVVHRTMVAAENPTGTINGQCYYDYVWNTPAGNGIYHAELTGLNEEGSVHARTTFMIR